MTSSETTSSSDRLTLLVSEEPNPVTQEWELQMIDHFECGRHRVFQKELSKMLMTHPKLFRTMDIGQEDEQGDNRLDVDELLDHFVNLLNPKIVRFMHQAIVEVEQDSRERLAQHTAYSSIALENLRNANDLSVTGPPTISYLSFHKYTQGRRMITPKMRGSHGVGWLFHKLKSMDFKDIDLNGNDLITRDELHHLFDSEVDSTAVVDALFDSIKHKSDEDGVSPRELSLSLKTVERILSEAKDKPVRITKPYELGDKVRLKNGHKGQVKAVIVNEDDRNNVHYGLRLLFDDCGDSNGVWSSNSRRYFSCPDRSAEFIAHAMIDGRTQFIPDFMDEEKYKVSKKVRLLDGSFGQIKWIGPDIQGRRTYGLRLLHESKDELQTHGDGVFSSLVRGDGETKFSCPPGYAVFVRAIHLAGLVSDRASEKWDFMSEGTASFSGSIDSSAPVGDDSSIVESPLVDHLDDPHSRHLEMKLQSFPMISEDKESMKEEYSTTTEKTADSASLDISTLLDSVMTPFRRINTDSESRSDSSRVSSVVSSECSDLMVGSKVTLVDGRDGQIKYITSHSDDYEQQTSSAMDGRRFGIRMAVDGSGDCSGFGDFHTDDNCATVVGREQISFTIRSTSIADWNFMDECYSVGDCVILNHARENAEAQVKWVGKDAEGFTVYGLRLVKQSTDPFQRIGDGVMPKIIRSEHNDIVSHGDGLRKFSCPMGFALFVRSREINKCLMKAELVAQGQAPFCYLAEPYSVGDCVRVRLKSTDLNEIAEERSRQLWSTLGDFGLETALQHVSTITLDGQIKYINDDIGDSKEEYSMGIHRDDISSGMLTLSDACTFGVRLCSKFEPENSDDDTDYDQISRLFYAPKGFAKVVYSPYDIVGLANDPSYDYLSEPYEIGDKVKLFDGSTGVVKYLSSDGSDGEQIIVGLHMDGEFMMDDSSMLMNERVKKDMIVAISDGLFENEYRFHCDDGCALFGDSGLIHDKLDSSPSSKMKKKREYPLMKDDESSSVMSLAEDCKSAEESLPPPPLSKLPEYKVGDRVELKDGSTGQIKWIGKSEIKKIKKKQKHRDHLNSDEQSQITIGVRMDQKMSEITFEDSFISDGRFEGNQRFLCPNDYGLFCKPDCIAKVIDIIQSDDDNDHSYHSSYMNEPYQLGDRVTLKDGRIGQIKFVSEVKPWRRDDPSSEVLKTRVLRGCNDIVYGVRIHDPVFESEDLSDGLLPKDQSVSGRDECYFECALNSGLYIPADQVTGLVKNDSSSAKWDYMDEKSPNSRASSLLNPEVYPSDLNPDNNNDDDKQKRAKREESSSSITITKDEKRSSRNLRLLSSGLQSSSVVSGVVQSKIMQAWRLIREASTASLKLSKRADEIEGSLNAAQAEVERTHKLIAKIKRAHWEELKAYRKPPLRVRLSLEAVLVLLGPENFGLKTPRKTGEFEWNSMRSVICQHGFVEKVLSHDPTTVSVERMVFVETHYTCRSDFTYEMIMKSSHACGPLALWVLSQVNHDEYLRNESSLRREVSDLRAEFEQQKSFVEEAERTIHESGSAKDDCGPLMSASDATLFD